MVGSSLPPRHENLSPRGHWTGEEHWSRSWGDQRRKTLGVRSLGWGTLEGTSLRKQVSTAVWGGDGGLEAAVGRAGASRVFWEEGGSGSCCPSPLPRTRQLRLWSVERQDLDELVLIDQSTVPSCLSVLVHHFCGKLRQEEGLQGQGPHYKGTQPRPLQAQQ